MPRPSSQPPASPAPAGPVVMDSSAVLAYLRQERGAARVAELLGGARLSAVNYCEVLAKAAEFGGDATMVRRVMDEWGVARVPFADDHATLAASLRERTRRLGLSLGDRACVALAMLDRATVVTADRAWADLDLDGLDVHLIR